MKPDALLFSKHYTSSPLEFIEVDLWPPLKTPSAPKYVPERVAIFYLEAVGNVQTAPNAAGAMFRKAVDVALKHIAPATTGTLSSRIDKAADQGLVTQGLADWAHQVRLDGNDAVHEEDPFTPGEAERMHKFTELLLMYLFTLPGMLAERQEPSGGEGDEA